MAFEQIAISVLLPALVSALITIINNKRLKNLEFQYDYRKYMLEKRKAAYNEVEGILDLMLASVNISGTQDRIHSFANRKIDFPISEFNMRVVNCTNRGFWLSDKMLHELAELNDLLCAMEEEVGPQGTDRTINRKLGIKYFEDLNALTMRISEVYFEDICNLDDIDALKKKQLLVDVS